MTRKEKEISVLRRRVAELQKVVDEKTALLNDLKSKLDTAEMDNLKAVLNERGMTIEEILKTIASDTESVVNEKTVQPENKAETKTTNMEEKKNVGF